MKSRERERERGREGGREGGRRVRYISSGERMRDNERRLGIFLYCDRLKVLTLFSQ